MFSRFFRRNRHPGYLKIASVLLFCVFITFGCSSSNDGGIGDPEDTVAGATDEGTMVTVTGTVDDGTSSSPISNAVCAFVDLSGDQLAQTTADNIGNFSIDVPPGVKGNIQCAPPAIPKLILSTFLSTEDRDNGDEIAGEDVTPATTFFSHSIATKLSGDLSKLKENYLDDTAGLGDIQIIKDGETITNFEVNDTSNPKNKDVGLVAFSATSLFNILFKNGINIDYLAALDDFIAKKEVDCTNIESLGIRIETAARWCEVVNRSNDNAGASLGTDLESALSTARINVKVTDTPGGEGIPGAEIKITDAPSEVQCDCDLPLITDNNGEVTLTLTGVPAEVIQVEVEASSAAGFKTTTRTIQIVGFATVDLEIALIPEFNLSVQGGDTGTGLVSSTPSGFSCSIDGTNESGICSLTYSSGTEVTLYAEPSQGSTIDGWSVSSCGTASSCDVIIDQDLTVTVSFEPASPVPPTISNPAWELIQLNDSGCNLYGDPVGSLFLITFDYADPNGNGPTNISEAKIDLAWDFPGCCDGGFNNYTWNSSLSGDGYSGTITTNQCYSFGTNSYVDVTMTIEDLNSDRSSPQTVRIDKPSGSN